MTRVLLALLLAGTMLADEPLLHLVPIASGIESPVSITNAGDSRLFITSQTGTVMIWDGTQLLPTPFLDIRSLVSSSGERGLLSIAFHPRYAENGLFFANYTDRNGDTVVARFFVSASDPNRADPTTRHQILFVDQPFANHNGGQLQFGPDGYLYIGMGDGGSGGDPGNRAQNTTVLLGKMLRVDVDAAEYAIPPSNPFAERSRYRPEIWALGLRNPWRFSFDRATGDLWIADVGQGDWEEIDFQPATSIGGENYGWRRMEGTHCFNPPSGCRSDPSLVLPVIEYGHSNGACSVTGGYVYRGTQFPRFRATYFYGDYCSGVIFGARRADDGTIMTRELSDAGFNISTFGEGADGELYIADYRGGRILRITDTAPMGGRRRAVRH